MQYKTNLSTPLDLPNSEQLENFRSLCRDLQDNSRSVPPLEQAAFRDLILGMCPGAGESWEYGTIQHLFPDEWRRYCEQEWGTIEEQQALKEE